MRYLTDDGKVFNTIEEAKEHEEVKIIDKKHQEMLEDLDELLSIHKEFVTKCDEYDEKYNLLSEYIDNDNKTEMLEVEDLLSILGLLK